MKSSLSHLTILVGITTFLFLLSSVFANDEMKIALVPIGPVPNELLNWCKQHLSDFVEVEVTLTDQTNLPRSAFNANRKQYLGDALLEELKLRNVKADRILGIVDQDCYTSGLNFVFGQASSMGREAFVALPRLRQSFYGLPEDPELFRQRVLKEIIHELGHTWGLPHCSNPKCIMYFSNTLQDTDNKGPGFCSICSKRLP